ncbi:MAG TPA: FAD-binding domain-containing protein, partial [Mucilaginibacter sp.]
PCIDAPEIINIPNITHAGKLPTLQELGLDEPADDPRATNKFIGGETAALNQLESFFLNNNHAGAHKNARNTPGNDHSSKLSPWIALGCVSLRQVYWEVIKHQHSNTNHTDLLVLDLLWRDYFRFMFKKHGQKFISGKNKDDKMPLNANDKVGLFETWKNGATGIPLVDAIMHELNATGYINNYSRQIAAAFLIKDLKVDWKKGAAYFEEKLIDYSPASNWGNWAFMAGVNDARESRYAIAAIPANEQTKNDFIDTWLPAATITD